MSQVKVNAYEDAVEKAILQLCGKNKKVQKRTSDIERYYNVWKGKADWLEYSVWIAGVEQTATYLTLNVPRYICKTWANNYANEDTKIILPNEASNERWQEILFNNNVFGKFNSFVDSFMGLGCGAMLVNVDKQLENEETGERFVHPQADVKINFIGGRRIIPITIDDGEVTECAFTTYSTQEVKIIIHYKREDGFYNIAELRGQNINGNTTFDFDNISIFKTMSDKPLFVYWKPNLAEDDDIEAGCGQSIFEGALDTFKQCDLSYTALWKEIKLGQKQLFVSSDIDIVNSDGTRTNPLPMTEGIISLPSGADGKTMLQDFNGELRIQQIVSDLNFHLNCAGMLCGLGQNSFEFEGGGRPIQTATGVIAKQTELYRNVIKQENFARDRFIKLVQAVQYVNNEMTARPKIEVERLQDIQITFDDNILEDTAQKKQNDLQEVQAGVKSISEYRKDWCDEDEETATKSTQDMGLLALKFLPILQAGGISPQHYCELVWGNTDDLDYVLSQFAPTEADDTIGDDGEDLTETEDKAEDTSLNNSDEPSEKEEDEA